jgi:hypothetical protein
LTSAFRLGSLDQDNEVPDKLGAEQVHGRCRDLNEEHGPVGPHIERLEYPVLRRD